MVFNWKPQDGVDKLRFFFLSMGDPSLVIVTPSGSVLCSDNLNPLVRDPYIEVENPEEGQYIAFLGTNQEGVNYPGFVVVTTKDFNPATMNIAQLFPRKVDPRGIPQALDLNDLRSKTRLHTNPIRNAWQR